MSRLTSPSLQIRLYAAGLYFALRQLRRPGIGIGALFGTLIFAITTLSLTVNLTHSVRDAMRQSAQQTIGGDISLRLFHRPPTDQEKVFLTKFGTLAITAEQRVMIRSSLQSPAILSELKAIDRSYPLYGDLLLSPGITAQNALEIRDGVGGAIVDPGFLEQSGLALNDEITVGDQTYQIRATLLAEPEHKFRLFSLGPRVLVSLDAYGLNELLSSDKQIYWYSRLKRAPDSSISNARIITEIEGQFPDSGWRIVNADDGIPGIERIGDFASAFASLIGIAIFAITMTAIGNALRADLSARSSEFALMRAVGVRPSQLIFAIGCMVGLVTLAAVIAAFALSHVVTIALAPMLATRFGIVIAPGPGNALLIFGFVVCFVTLIALGPIRKACQVNAASLFRDQSSQSAPPFAISGPLRSPRLLLAALLILATTGFAVRLIDLGWFSVLLIAALGLCLACFVGLGWLVRKGSSILARGTNGSAAWRLALRNIARPSAPTITIAASFGLAVTCLLAVVLFGTIAGHHLKSVLPGQTPDLVFFDLPPEQSDAFRAVASGDPAISSLARMPFLHGRVTRINGRPVSLSEIPRRYHWFIRGDRGLSWTNAPTSSMAQSRLIAGNWWTRDSVNERLASLDADIAAALGITIGDQITVNILGEPITVKIANLRKIDWTRLALDFPIVLSPMDPPPPHGLITALSLHEPDLIAHQTVTKVADRLQGQFPHVPMIRVAGVLERLSGMFDQVRAILIAQTVLATLGAVLVIVTGLIALRQHAAGELAMLRALGIQPRQIIQTGALETGIVVTVSGMLGIVMGTGIALASSFAIGSINISQVAPLFTSTGLVALGVIALFGFGGGWILQMASLRSQPGWRG